MHKKVRNAQLRIILFGTGGIKASFDAKYNCNNILDKWGTLKMGWVRYTLNKIVN